VDITQLAALAAQDEQGAVVEILDKQGEPFRDADGSACTMTVVGKESSRYRAALDRVQRGALRMRRTRLTPEQLFQNRVELAAAAVTGWHGWTANGTAVACTVDNVRAVLGASLHILEQIEQAIDGHADFFATSSSS
jgi:hypothetical protein